MRSGFRRSTSSICFVRNPYARLRSAWQNKFAYGHTQGWSRSIRRKELGRLRHFARAANLEGAAHGSAIPFETFLAYVESQPAGTRDHHWDDQYRVLLMDHIRYEHWFRMEGEFTAGMREIFERIGLTGPVVGTNPRDPKKHQSENRSASVHAATRRARAPALCAGFRDVWLRRRILARTLSLPLRGFRGARLEAILKHCQVMQRHSGGCIGVR